MPNIFVLLAATLFTLLLSTGYGANAIRMQEERMPEFRMSRLPMLNLRVRKLVEILD